MMRNRVSQSAFIGGELDEQARARANTAIYRNGAAGLRNCLLLGTGGVKTRWGSRTLTTLTGEDAVLVDFVFSEDQAYIAMFQPGRVDFFYATDGAAAGSIGGLPWSAGNLRSLRFAQGGDLMWVVCEDFHPILLRRTGAETWTAEQMAFDSPTGTPFYRYASGSITATWDGTYLNFSGAWLEGGHQGTMIRYYDATNTVYRCGYISFVIDEQTAQVAWDGTAPATGVASPLWEEQAASRVRGYFRAVALYQQRLVFGGTRDAGDAVWASQTGLFFNFNLGSALDNEGIAVVLGATSVRSIRHVVAGPQLTFFTDSGVFYVPLEEQRAIAPARMQVRHIAPYGCRNARPGLFDGGILFAQATAVAVRDLSYSSERDNLIADPVSLAATGYLGAITDAAYLPGVRGRAEQYAFFVNEAGGLSLYHSIREQEIAAWAPWTTEGEFVSVGAAGGKLFAVVRRAGTLRLELFDEDSFFDAEAGGVTPDLVAAHLPSLTVHGRIGNDYLGSGEADETGAVTLTRQRAEVGGVDDGAAVRLGLAFEWWIEPLPPSFDAPDGSILRRPTRLLTTNLLLLGARTAQMRGGEMVLRTDGFAIGETPASYSGWWRFRHLGYTRPQDPGDMAAIRVTREVPMPVGVLAMVRECIIA